MTVTPLNSLLVNFTWRQSHRLDTGSTFGQTASPTTGTGNEAWQKIGTVDGSWIINSRSFATFKYTYFSNPTQGRPDYVADVAPSQTVGTPLDVGEPRQDRPVQGARRRWPARTLQRVHRAVDRPVRLRLATTGQRPAAARSATTPSSTSRASTATPYRCAYNITLGSTVRQDVHAGFQWSMDSEDLLRTSNGWGSISGPRRPAASAGIRRRRTPTTWPPTCSRRRAPCRRFTPSTSRSTSR